MSRKKDRSESSILSEQLTSHTDSMLSPVPRGDESFKSFKELRVSMIALGDK